MAARDPVIVVGGGPAGLAVATQLVLKHVDVVVLEAEPRLPRDLRAGSFHPPTIEMLDTIGVGQEFLSLGYRVPRWQIRGRKEGVIVEWDLSLISDVTPYPFRFHCEQFKLTPLLLKRFEDLGGKVRFAHRFLDATQDADGVIGAVRDPGRDRNHPRQLSRRRRWREERGAPRHERRFRGLHLARAVPGGRHRPRPGARGLHHERLCLRSGRLVGDLQDAA